MIALGGYDVGNRRQRPGYSKDEWTKMAVKMYKFALMFERDHLDPYGKTSLEGISYIPPDLKKIVNERRQKRREQDKSGSPESHEGLED